MKSIESSEFYRRKYGNPDKWIPVTTAWRVFGLLVEKRPPLLMVSTNIWNKQLWTTDKRWSSAWGLGEVLTTPHHKNWHSHETYTRSSDLD
jgi:hypothetical protein